MQAATGMTPMLYMSPSFAPYAGTGFGGHPLWIANWGAACPSVPAPWSTWAFWQTSDMGTIPGIPATVDLDEFNGPLAELPVLGTSTGADGGADGGREGGAYADAGVAGLDGGDGGEAGDASDDAPGPGASMGSGGSPGACR
jgi:hypothetical protein